VKSFFFRQKFSHGIADEVQVESLAGMGRSRWIVGRSLCLYKVFFIPSGIQDKNETLSLQLQQWSPFSKTSQYVVWQGNNALVWIWDEGTRQELLQQFDASKAEVIPEDLFFPLPLENGVRVVQCLSGVVAQYWQDDVLLDSQWWMEYPTSDELRQFYRSNDLSLPAQLPECVSLPSIKTPWGVATSLHGSGGFQYEQYLLPFFCVLFLVFGYQAMTLIKWTQFEKQLVGRVTDLTKQVEPILTARQRTYEDKAMITEFTKLSPYPAQLHLWAVVVRKLRGLKATVKSWKFNNGTLELVIEGDKLDPGDCIRVFSQEKIFTDVSAVNDRNDGNLQLKMTVLKRAMQAPVGAE